MGAATWGSGTAGVAGTITASNSLIGSTSSSYGYGDQIGSGGVTALTNGNYVVKSSTWTGGDGAATWGNGATGTTGIVSASNSLVGTIDQDAVSGGGVTATRQRQLRCVQPRLGPGLFTSYGAATWGSGGTGITGIVSASNSLVGASDDDDVSFGGVTALTNGNYVVCSLAWQGGNGAVTWGKGTTGITGAVSASNSLVGSSAAQIGSGGVTALLNGDYVVESPLWHNSEGAATWVNGAAAAVGVVSASNSLVGSSGGTSGDQVSSGGVVVLPDGNFVVLSPQWNNSKGSSDLGQRRHGNHRNPLFRQQHRWRHGRRRRRPGGLGRRHRAGRRQFRGQQPEMEQRRGSCDLDRRRHGDHPRRPEHLRRRQQPPGRRQRRRA